jgi:hypothetical protein
MIVSALLIDLKLHARITGDHDDPALALLLETAAGDVAHAAGITLPDDAGDLPRDLGFAIVDQAARSYDQRGADDGPPGLTPAASRIVHRYRGVRIHTPEPPVDEGAT